MSDGFVYLIVNMQAGAWKRISTYICIHLHAYSQGLKRREALKQPRRQRRQLIVGQTPAQAQAASDWRGGCLTRAPRATRAHPSHPCSSCSVRDAHVCPCIRVCGRTVRMHTRAHKLTRAYKHMYMGDIMSYVHTISVPVAQSSRHNML